MEKKAEKPVLSLESDNTYLEEAFEWAVKKTKQFVVTGTKKGKINYGDGNLYYGMNGAIGNPDKDDWCRPADYAPCYWAGYFDRTAYYSRDFVHQSTGAHLVGLDAENYNMFHTFAANCREYLGWYTPWAFNFDNSIYLMDYQRTIHDGYEEDYFVREVTAQFELVEKAYRAYLWTGDKRYLLDEVMWDFYGKVLNEFVEMHDGLCRNGGQKNGVAEGCGDIWHGAASYNERSIYPAEAGDSFASQYAATLAYAAMLKERGEYTRSECFTQKAKSLKTYFNDDWSVAEGTELYTYVIDENGGKHYEWTRSGKAGVNGGEACVFLPLKGITQPGKRNSQYMQYITDKLEDPATTCFNIESFTYLPDMYFRYNRKETAWRWMRYIIDRKDLPHERPSQGTNGDYPEISFTLISQIVEGMMGIEPNAAGHALSSLARLPEDIRHVTVKNVVMGDHLLELTHDGLQKSILTNHSEKELLWEARFYGHFGKLCDGNKNPLKISYKQIDGEEVTCAQIRIAAGGTALAEVIG